MKLRIRLQSRTERVQLDDNCSLCALKTSVAQTFGLAPDSFELSLNGRDVLQGTTETLLSEYDIVSGDLIRVLQTTQDNQATTQSEQTANTKKQPIEHQKGTGQRCTTIASSSSSLPSVSNRSTSQPPNMSNCDKPSTSQQNEEAPSTSSQSGEAEKMDCSEGALSRINEPMLCRESTDTTIPLRLRQLLNEWQVTNPCEVLCIALHVLMLETGFMAKLSQDVKCKKSKRDTPSALDNSTDANTDLTSAMPTGWKSSSVAYKVTYTHSMCEGAECSLAWVPLGSVLMVHALTTGQNHFQLKLNASDYVVKHTKEQQDNCVPLRQLASLSRQYKDSIAYPLLEAVRSELGLAPLHGLMALVPEIQLLVLSYLDATSLLRMSQVCNHFHSITTDALLWRQLVLRDFGGRTDDSNANWRELYKQKYQSRLEMERARSRMTYVYPPLIPPHHGMVPPLPDPMHPMYPPGYRGGDYDLDPFSGGPLFPGGRRGGGRLPNAGPFPGARHDPVFPESNHRPGRGGGLRDATGGRSGGRNRLFPGGGGGFGF